MADSRRSERRKEQRGFMPRRIWVNGLRVVFMTGNGFSLSIWAFGQWSRVVVSHG